MSLGSLKRTGKERLSSSFEAARDAPAPAPRGAIDVEPQLKSSPSAIARTGGEPWTPAGIAWPSCVRSPSCTKLFMLLGSVTNLAWGGRTRHEEPGPE